MLLFRKLLLKWREPKAVMDSKRRKSKNIWKLQLLFAMALALFFFIGWVLTSHALSFQVFFPLELLISIGIAYVIPWSYRFANSDIRLYDDRILFMFTHQIHYFKSLDTCEIRPFMDEFNKDSVLVIKSYEGKNIYIGIETVLADELEKILKSIHVHVVRNNTPLCLD